MRHFRFPVAAISIALFAAPSFAQPSIPFGDAGIHAIQFIDQSEGWAVGDDGVIWHSIDGGANWERQKTGTRASLRSLHFLTPYTGWAVGRSEIASGGGSVGIMLRTTDGGIHWDEVGTNAMPGLHAVQFFDEKHGIICGDGSSAFPSGIFTSSDGGHTWRQTMGVKLPSCRAASFFAGSNAGVVAGAWSRLGTISMDGAYREADFDPLAGRTLHAVSTSTTKHSPSSAYAVGDGGAVLVSSDRGKSWGFANLGLSPDVLAVCDFRCVSSVGPHVWVAGKPGGFVLHSADNGKNWEVQKTELPLPIYGIHFLSEQIGWMVGELGSIFGTVDGGKTWKIQRAGGQRAAVLCMHSSHRSTPLDVVALLGHADGYLCASMAFMSADPATADPKRTGDSARLRQAMRLSGGASGDVGWAFPIAAHAGGLPPRELLSSWDRMHGGKAAEHLLRQAVLAIRMWRPEVIVTDAVAADAVSADVLMLHAAKEAFKQAADPNCFPEQLTTLGLKVWGAKKLYSLATQPQSAQVRLDQSIFCTALGDSPRDFTEDATRILADDSAVADRRCFILLAHRLQDADKHANLMDGIALARGGVARRPEEIATVDLNAVEEKKRATETRHRLEAMAGIADPELGGPDKMLATLSLDLKRLPDDTAARTAHALANRLAREGKWAEAREVFGILASQYPGHPLAIEGYRWLVRYHSSSEARRRTEIQQKMLLKSASFQSSTGPAPNIRLTSGDSATSGSPVVQEDSYHLYSPEAVLQWHQACLDLEPKLTAFGPLHSHDPAAWLCFLAARRQVGRHADSIVFIRDYFKHTPGLATMAPGTDPWRDCLAAELWMTDRTLIPTQPKPLGVCRHTELRPMLDGKLDDACWQDLKPLSLTVASSGMDKPDEMKAFGVGYKTETRFAYDDRFLYIAISCSHPVGQKVEPVAKRTRDADMTGHDRVDILLDLDRDYQTYYRFQVDHRGCLAEDCWGDKTWNPKYFAAFNSTDTGWTAEIAIPLIELTGDRPSHGRVWAANVSRIVPGKGIQSWSGPADDTPRPEGMGLLQFRADR
jgi:photosystem II stability/assembly factor-like uncharacterized protein